MYKVYSSSYNKHYLSFNYMNKTNHPISSNSHPLATTNKAIRSLNRGEGDGGGYKTIENMI